MYILQIDGRTDGHKKGRLDGNTDIRTDPNNIRLSGNLPDIRSTPDI